MKHSLFLTAIAACALTGAPSFALQTPATQARAETNVVDEHETRVDRAFASLREHAEKKSASKAEFDALRTALKEQSDALESTHPRAKSLRERLEKSIDELEAKAQSGVLEARHVERLHEDLIDARLDRALDWLQRQAVKRDATRADYERVAAALTHRADAAKSKDQDSGTERERLAKLVDELEARGKSYVLAESDFSPLRSAIIDARLNRAMNWLEDQAVSRDASRADFERVSHLLEERAEAAKGTDPEIGNQTQRLQKALAKLQERALTNGLTREEVHDLREQLVKKAREANGPKR